MRFCMRSSITALFSTTLVLAAGASFAQDAMKKDDTMAKDTMGMTLKDCQDHMAMQKKEMKKDEASMKKDAACADMMNKDAMKKDSMKTKKRSHHTLKPAMPRGA